MSCLPQRLTRPILTHNQNGRSVTGRKSGVILAVGLLLSSQAVQAQSAPLQQIKNPYCAVKTLIQPQFSGQARAWRLPGGEPVIYLSANYRTISAYRNFLLAHECCHHSRGHVTRLYNAMARNGRILTYTRAMIQIELDADCCAAKALAKLKDKNAINAAMRVMNGYGRQRTGRKYPTGNARKAVITNCSGLEQGGK